MISNIGSPLGVVYYFLQQDKVKVGSQSQPSLTAARCADCCDRSNFQMRDHAILNQKPLSMFKAYK